ncbi:UNVERIFIED_CONTAM: hypothetical protein Sangu_2242000, partial [Sesamum angustifolium]
MASSSKSLYKFGNQSTLEVMHLQLGYSKSRSLKMELSKKQNCLLVDTGWVKLNIDGASKGNPGLAWLELEALSETMREKSSFTFSEPIGFTNNMEAEMHVVLRGFCICLEKGFSKVWLELDALHVIHLIFKQVRGV